MSVVEVPRDFLFDLGKIDLTGEQYRILHYLMSQMDENGAIYVTLTDLGKELGMQVPNVCRGIKTLMKRNLIVRIGKRSRAWGYTLNFNLAS